MSHFCCFFIFFFNDTATTEIYTLSLHDALPIFPVSSVSPPPYEPRLEAVPHRFDRDAFDHLAIPHAVDLGLQIHPDADMYGQDFDPVAHGKMGPGVRQVEDAMLLRKAREAARRPIAQMAEAEGAVPRHGERLAAGIHRDAIAVQADDGGEHHRGDGIGRAG